MRSRSAPAASSTSSRAASAGTRESIRLHDLCARARHSGLARRHARERHRPRAQHPPVDAAEFHAAGRHRRQPPLLRAGSDRSADRGRRRRRHRCARRARHRRDGRLGSCPSMRRSNTIEAERRSHSVQTYEPNISPFVIVGHAGRAASRARAPALRRRRPQAPCHQRRPEDGWMLRLEDQRILRVPPPHGAACRRRPLEAKRPRAPPPPPPTPDLLKLVTDPEARIRRRAALAIGRVGLPEGVAPLQTALADTDPDVRQMAAFGLGLIGDASAVPALTTALQDADPVVRGRAAEALGLIGDTAPAAAVGAMTAALRQAGRDRVAGARRRALADAPEADAARLGLFALVRLTAWDAARRRRARLLRPSRQRLVAGRVRPAADQRSPRASTAAAARAGAGTLHPRVRRARPRPTERCHRPHRCLSRCFS